MLWKILNTNAWILGTHHGPPQIRSGLPPAWQVPWEECRQLVVESRFDEPFVPPINEYTDGRRLSQDVPPDLLELVRAAWVAYDLSEEVLETLVPRCVGLTLGMQAGLAIGLDFQNGIDKKLVKDAKERGYAIHALELPCAPFAAMDEKVPAQEHLELLFQASKDIEKAKNDAFLLSEAWFHGRVDVAEKFLDSRFKNTPVFKSVLITDRNALWLDSIRKHVQGEIPTLIAVGFLHTVGPDSILALLEREGFQFDHIAR